MTAAHPGEKLKQTRESLNLNQEELAERLGVSQQSIARWEAGLSEPRAKVREKMSQEIGFNWMLTAADLMVDKRPQDRQNDPIGALDWQPRKIAEQKARYNDIAKHNEKRLRLIALGDNIEAQKYQGIMRRSAVTRVPLFFESDKMYCRFHLMRETHDYMLEAKLFNLAIKQKLDSSRLYALLALTPHDEPGSKAAPNIMQSEAVRYAPLFGLQIFMGNVEEVTDYLGFLVDGFDLKGTYTGGEKDEFEWDDDPLND